MVSMDVEDVLARDYAMTVAQAGAEGRPNHFPV